MADTPNLKVSDLTADELEALQGLGRIQGDSVLPAAAPVASALPASEIPAMSPEVSARISKVKQLESSFIHEDKEKGTVSTSQDGGEAAKQVVKDIHVVNPDWAGKPVEDPIEAADKERFLAMLLGADAFKKSYDLFGSALRVTFRTRTAAQEDEIARQVFRDERRDGTGGQAPDELRSARMARFGSYQLTAALESIGRPNDVPRRFDPFQHPKSNQDAQMGAIRCSYDDLVAATPQPLLVAIQQIHRRFETLVARMTLASDQPDFWKVAAGT